MTFILSTPDEVLATIGNRLREQRIARELPQSELAAMTGLSLGAIRKLESSGKSSLDTLVRVAQALGLVSELDCLFELKRDSIAQMRMVERTHQRKRAPKRKRQ